MYCVLYSKNAPALKYMADALDSLERFEQALDPLTLLAAELLHRLVCVCVCVRLCVCVCVYKYMYIMYIYGTHIYTHYIYV